MLAHRNILIIVSRERESYQGYLDAKLPFELLVEWAHCSRLQFVGHSLNLRLFEFPVFLCALSILFFKLLLHCTTTQTGPLLVNHGKTFNTNKRDE